MLWDHKSCCLVFVHPNIVEKLFVVKKPVSIEKHTKRSILHYTQNWLAKQVIHSWWLSHGVGYLASLGKSLVGNDKSCHWEHNWHSQSIKHCQESDIHTIWILKVNLPFFSSPNWYILLHGNFLRLKSISSASRVKTCQQFEKSKFFD